MNYFKDSFTIKEIITYLFVFLIFFPKINIINIGGSGLRIEDFLIIFLLFLSVKSLLKTNDNFDIEYLKNLIKIYKYVIILVLLSFVSIIVNREFNIINILYSVRILEYSIFIIFGFVLSRYQVNLEKIIVWYGIFNIILIFLQHYKLIGGFFNGNYDISARPMGLTGGAYEVSVILIISFIVLNEILNKDKKDKIKNYFLTYIYLSFVTISIFLNGARIAFASLVLILVYYFRKNIKLLLIVIFSIIILTLIFNENILLKRSKLLFSKENVNLIVEVYKSIDIKKDLEFYTKPLNEIGNIIEGCNINPENCKNIQNKTDNKLFKYDPSWLIRIHKWAYVVKYTISNPMRILVGSSPGKFGSAVDGSFIRIFGELGIIGLLLYLLMIKELIINERLKLIILVLLVNMLFIDVIYAYKIMAIIFSLYGYYLQKGIKHEYIDYHSNI
jgi:hypothetical protein